MIIIIYALSLPVARHPSPSSFRIYSDDDDDDNNNSGRLIVFRRKRTESQKTAPSKQRKSTSPINILPSRLPSPLGTLFCGAWS